VVQAELYHGAYKSGREANLKLVRSFLSLFESLPFDVPPPKFTGGYEQNWKSG